MLNKLKQIKITKKGLYISLAICMLLVGCIGIYASIRNMNKIVEESDFIYENTPTSLEPKIQSPFDSMQEKEVISPSVETENTVVLDFIKPVDGDIAKEFSGSELVYSETMNDYRTHTGVDILACDGTAVYSTESGTITSIDKHPLWGSCVTVEHENGFSSCYKNLSDTLPEGIEIGSYITKGGIIGSIGTTALVEIGENPHLHFEMFVNGEPVNPTEYFG